MSRSVFVVCICLLLTVGCQSRFWPRQQQPSDYSAETLPWGNSATVLFASIGGDVPIVANQPDPFPILISDGTQLLITENIYDAVNWQTLRPGDAIIARGEPYEGAVAGQYFFTAETITYTPDEQ